MLWHSSGLLQNQKVQAQRNALACHQRTDMNG